ncbi:zinc finger protein 70-like [Folsomia candida]|uniref:zinc finger protein 70-like n=1 Tax=Folsomia candida TaxID=158441 RepID=UPI001604D743|nr:zinc finger protein 70-like [Folsomia candida]
MHSGKSKLFCAICPGEFTTASGLRKHIERFHTGIERARLPCGFPGCEKTYLNKNHLVTHFNVEHAENPVRYGCTLCSKEFKRKEHLERHTAAHTTEKPYKCQTCGAGFGQHSSLKKHELIHLDKSARHVLKCGLWYRLTQLCKPVSRRFHRI